MKVKKIIYIYIHSIYIYIFLVYKYEYMYVSTYIHTYIKKTWVGIWTELQCTCTMCLLSPCRTSPDCSSMRWWGKDGVTSRLWNTTCCISPVTTHPTWKWMIKRFPTHLNWNTTKTFLLCVVGQGAWARWKRVFYGLQFLFPLFHGGTAKFFGSSDIIIRVQMLQYPIYITYRRRPYHAANWTRWRIFSWRYWGCIWGGEKICGKLARFFVLGYMELLTILLTYIYSNHTNLKISLMSRRWEMPWAVTEKCTEWAWQVTNLSRLGWITL